MLQDLRATLVQNHVRVIDLFRDWDEDESGRIDRTEFRRGLLALGIKAPREELDALFGSFDLDRSGQLDFRELNAALRREAEALPAALQPGAAATAITCRPVQRVAAAGRQSLNTS